MRGIDEKNLDTAITLGDAVCKELGICCDKRGQVIFRIYQKLREMKPNKDIPMEPAAYEAREAANTSSLSSDKS